MNPKDHPEDDDAEVDENYNPEEPVAWCSVEGKRSRKPQNPQKQTVSEN